MSQLFHQPQRTQLLQFQSTLAALEAQQIQFLQRKSLGEALDIDPTPQGKGPQHPPYVTGGNALRAETILSRFRAPTIVSAAREIFAMLTRHSVCRHLVTRQLSDDCQTMSQGAQLRHLSILVHDPLLGPREKQLVAIISEGAEPS